MVRFSDMLGGNGKDILYAERIEIVDQALFGACIALINHQGNGFAGFPEQGRELTVGTRDFAPAIDQEDHLRSLFERHTRLGKYLAGDVIGVTYNNAARVDKFEPRPSCVA